MIARSVRLFILPVLLLSTLGELATAQTTAVEKFKAMSGDLDALDGKLKKEKERPPFEFFKSQVTPFETLPYIKRNHWFTLNIEMVANAGDYDGNLQTSAELNGRAQIPLYDPNDPRNDLRNEMIFRRGVRLQKEQRARPSLQMFLPQFTKELSLELTHPDAIRPDGFWAALFLKLEPHQMVIPVLSPDTSLYASWGRMQATLPASGDRDHGSVEIEKQRYYRFSLPSERPPFSTNALTWTSISHIVWDGLDPESLTTAQQRAMIDWLYLGGQLIIVAAGPTAVAPLEQSFLKDYMPASDSGKGLRFAEKELEPLSRAYPPPAWPEDYGEIEGVRRSTPIPALVRYKRPEPIRASAEKPIFVAGLVAKPGATTITMGDDAKTPLAVEWRLGRGRVLMLAVNPNDPAFAAWPGMDSLVRRVLLRRIEETPITSPDRRTYAFLGAPELTGIRLLGRDLGALERFDPKDPGDQPEPNDPVNRRPVAAWSDNRSDMPVMSRDVLELASGITIPGSNFVLKVILAYIVVLVPANWLVCRYLLRRRELAWVMVPLLSLGFAVAVERAAAYDMGFDSDCTEIDLLELQGGYNRGHLSRFASIYSTGRDKYSISYPNDPTALALPLNTQRALRGEESTMSVFESFPEPALKGFQVQPRSLSLFRSEAIVELPGMAEGSPQGISLGGEAGDKLVNNTPLDLHEAVLIDIDSGKTTKLGTIGAGETAALTGPHEGTKAKPATVDWTEVTPFLDKLTSYRFQVPEERGELRLVAWAPSPHPGQTIEPKVDRHRGFRLVVVHLKYGPPPNPAGPEYYTASSIATASNPLENPASQNRLISESEVARP